MEDDDDLLGQLLEEVNEDDLLEKLLSTAAEDQEQPHKARNLTETNIFDQASNIQPSRPIRKDKSSTVHSGDTDSSDDESNRNCEDKKYNESGREIKQLLDLASSNKLSAKPSVSTFVKPVFNQQKQTHSWKAKPRTSNLASRPINTPNVSVVKQDVYTDPIFGMRIINPVISSAVLKERMVSREAVQFNKIARFVQMGNKDKDWVICGVIASKSPVKESQKGTKFAIWTLTDLKGDIKMISLFLFNSAFKDLWKTAAGTVIGILNPNVMENREGSKHEACLSVDNSQKVMIFGQSKDFGICKSKKKSGDQCTSVVNTNSCEYCIYHIKQEYQRCSVRSELQANFCGKGLQALQNKVLGKNEVFYAGKSFMAKPTKKSKKLEQKDQSRLQSLSGMNPLSNNISKAKGKVGVKKGQARALEISQAQRMRDMELLKKLGGDTGIDDKNNFSGELSSIVTLEESKSSALNILNKLKVKKKQEAVVDRRLEYDAKSDLIIGVDDKKKFENKLSSKVTLEDSKNTAKNIISKLKSKKPIEQTENVEKNKDNTSFNFSDDDDLDINYDDIDISFEESLSTKPNKDEHEKPIMQNSKNEINISKSLPKTPVSKDNSEKSKTVIKTPETVHQNSEAVGKKRDSLVNKSNNLAKKPQPLKLAISDSLAMDIPVLVGFSGCDIDLNKPITVRHKDRAKQNAIKLIQRIGPIQKANPNNVRGSGKKRNLEETRVIDPKRQKLEENQFISDRFKKMMAKTSKHLDLVDQHDDEEKDKYFNKLEIKEKMEEKMANTFKVACKAVTCTVCKYTSFSAADLCKQERHALKVFDAMKRFYKCGNCQNRTVTLTIVPTKPCTNCGSSKWEKTGMMKEKIVTTDHQLSIRGGEQKFVDGVCKKFNEIGSKMLSRGFIQMEKKHSQIYKRVKSLLPRRESERRAHPLSRHCDILQAVETRISMLSMTYIKYIENNLLCFIPGKVLDEMRNVLSLVNSDVTPPRTHQLLQELRDLSSMAMEHFDEHILPRVKEEMERNTAVKYRAASARATSKTPPLFFAQQVLYNEICKVKKQTKSQKQYITYLTQNTQKLVQKLRKQNFRLKKQSVKIREQERKIREQNTKIQEQESTLAEIKKHIDEWDQKYADLTTELVRAREDILLKASPPNSGNTMPTNKFFKTSIKPRSASVLPKNYTLHMFDMERKRKSNLLPEIPVKLTRCDDDSNSKKDTSKPPIINLINKELMLKESDNSQLLCNTDIGSLISNSIETLKNSLNIKTRKRKMSDDIDLK